MSSSDTFLSSSRFKHLLPITDEEQELLDLYSTLRQFEKQSALAKAEAAKAKLDAANQEFQREKGLDTATSVAVGGLGRENVTDEIRMPISVTSSTHEKHSRKRKMEGSNRAGKKDYKDDGSKSSDYDSREASADELTDTDDEDKQTARRNEAKIAQLRKERDLAIQRRDEEEAPVRAEEELRKKLLEGDRDAVDLSDFGPSLKKKRVVDTEDGKERKQTSLISNMSYASTPPHDFSKSLNLTKITGKQLFPASTVGKQLEDMVWSPPENPSSPEDRCLELDLDGFDAAKVAMGGGNNTVAIKFSAPSESSRFSINIVDPDHENYNSVLFHFNPRQFEKGGQVVINDKQSGIWGQGLNVPISTLPLMFGEASCTLIIQMNGDGFDAFVNGYHCARLEHRTPLPPKAKSLVLQFPSTDDYVKRENWTVYKVWWGYKPSMASKDLSHVPGYNSHNFVHEKKLFVSGLPKIYAPSEIDLRRAELERAFHKYGGKQGVTVICPPNSTFAFVEVETEKSADLALREMAAKYRLSRARRSRHEALLEQRAAAEAEAKGVKNEASEWD